MEINQFYIAGKFITPDGKEVIELINPATEAALAGSQNTPSLASNL